MKVLKIERQNCKIDCTGFFYNFYEMPFKNGAWLNSFYKHLEL